MVFKSCIEKSFRTMDLDKHAHVKVSNTEKYTIAYVWYYIGNKMTDQSMHSTMVCLKNFSANIKRKWDDFSMHISIIL